MDAPLAMVSVLFDTNFCYKSLPLYIDVDLRDI